MRVVCIKPLRHHRSLFPRQILRREIRAYIYLLGARFEEGHYFGICFVAVADVHEILGQQVVSVAHQEDEYMKEVYVLEYNGVVVNILLKGILKEGGMLGPVHARLYMMADVVPIVPAFYIVLGVDTGNAVAVRVIRLRRVYERMLRPVARHGYDAERKERQYEHHYGSRRIHEAKRHTHSHEQQLSSHRSVQQTLLLFTEEVSAQMINTGK